MDVINYNIYLIFTFILGHLIAVDIKLKIVVALAVIVPKLIQLDGFIHIGTCFMST